MPVPGATLLLLVASMHMGEVSTVISAVGWATPQRPSGSPQTGSCAPQLRQVLEKLADVKVSNLPTDNVEVDFERSSSDGVAVHLELCAKDATDVTVVGSWTDWKVHSKLIANNDMFAGWVYMPVGTHLFKFIVDDAWITGNQFPIERDAVGNLNNIIVVVPPEHSESVNEISNESSVVANDLTRLSDASDATQACDTNNATQACDTSNATQACDTSNATQPCDTKGASKASSSSLVRKALSPFRFVFEVIFTPVRLLLQLVGLM